MLLRRARWASLPTAGRLIAIADATGVRCSGSEWTIYTLLLRPVGTDRAVILPPLMLPGREGPLWRLLFASLDEGVRERICALVCDGNPHLLAVGKEAGWVIQRCHFHLKAHLRSYLSWGPKSRNRIWGLLARLSIETVVTTGDPGQLARAIEVLHHLVPLLRSTKAQWTIRHLLRTLSQFRSYQTHPDLRLPTTSNAAESLIGLLKCHLRRTRGLSTKDAMTDHNQAVFQRKQTIYCPPGLQPN